ncbi:MAG: cytochrome c peroxidase [Ferruginibacter sp.]
MHLRKFLVIGILASLVLCFEFCSKDHNSTGTVIPEDPKPTLPSTTLNYNINYPAFLTSAMALQDNAPADNQLTNDGATLGRVLFYDKHLSKNNTISCASCHKAESSFTDLVQFSTGFEGGLTTRSSMDLLNVAFYESGKMFWDERSATLEAQVVQPIQNHVEMGESFPALVDKVKALDYYPALFQNAFGTTDIDSVKIAKAMAQFVRSIIPYQSKYDDVKQGLAAFTPAEQAGEQLFLNAAPPGQPTLTCAGCHKPPLFITSAPVQAFGLIDPADAGINNTGHFKMGSLRNVAASAPYFHNGTVPTLQAVLGSNIQFHGVAPQDVQNLIAFMQTLTDTKTLTEERFADPFK